MTEDPERPTAADDLRRWLGESTVPPDTSDRNADDRTVARWSPRRLTRFAAIVLPWLVTVVVVLAADPMPARPATAPPQAVQRGGSPAPVATSPAPVAASAAPTPAAPTPAAGPLAVGAVRDAVTRTGDTTTTALDSAAAEPAQRLADAAWLVRVHAVVLRGDRRRWRSARHEIWAVPVGARGGTTVVLDQPWRVSTGSPPTARIGWKPADVDIDDVRRVLRRAGLPASPPVVVERHPVLPDVLRATTGTRSGPAHVWLRSAPSLAVLGGEQPAAARR